MLVSLCRMCINILCRASVGIYDAAGCGALDYVPALFGWAVYPNLLMARTLEKIVQTFPYVGWVHCSASRTAQVCESM